jgi:hypothetical protein
MNSYSKNPNKVNENDSEAKFSSLRADSSNFSFDNYVSTDTNLSFEHKSPTSLTSETQIKKHYDDNIKVQKDLE